MDRYSERINLFGMSQRDRDLNRLKQSLLNDVQKSLSCKNVVVDGIERQLVIDSSAKPYLKDIKTLPNEIISVGQAITWNSSNWLVIEADSDSEVYTEGKMQECNWTLKFQSPDGTILSYPCIDETTQRIGEKETDVITLGDGVHNIKLPFDENTVLLAPDRRFFLSKHPTRPTPYKIIGDPNTTTYNYGGKGLIELRVKQDLFDEKVDNVELGICDYKEPTNTPPPVEGYSYSEIICSNPNNEITLGGSARTLTQKCFEADGTVTNGIIPVWSFNWNGFNASNFVVTYPTTDTCAIKVKENYDLVGESIVISVMGSNGGYGGEITLMITL